MVLIYLALFLYVLTSAVLLFLHFQKKEEGQTWLAALFCCFASFILILLSPLAGTVSNNPIIWFTSRSMVLTIDPVWGRFDWLIMVLLSLSTLVFILTSYIQRERKGFDRRTTFFLFSTTITGILTSITQRFVFLPFLIFLLDCTQIFYQFSEDRELFSTRGQVIPLIIKLSSIILLGYAAILVERSGEPDSITTNPLFLIILIAMLHLLAEFLQRITTKKAPNIKDQWMTLINTVFMLKMLSLLQQYPSITSDSKMIVILVVLLLVSFVMLFLWIVRPVDKTKDLFASGISITLASSFLFLGVREELVVFVLPIFFLWMNQQAGPNKKYLNILLLAIQTLFLIGVPFSPWYALNNNIVDGTKLSAGSVILLIMEGLYLAGFILHQVKEYNRKDHSDDEHHTKSETSSASWLILAVLAGTLLRGFVTSANWVHISWLHYLPAACLLFIPVYSLIYSRRASLVQTKSTYHVSGIQILDKTTQIILVIVNIFRQVFDGLSALLEGDGGLVWAIILLILLLTFYRGLVG